MLNRLPFWGQVALMAALALGLIVLVYVFWISDMQQRIDELEEDWMAKDREIRKGLAIQQRLPEFEREIEGLERTLADVATILPRDTETGDLLQWIKNLGDQSNLDLKSFSPGGLREVEFYKEFPIEMQVFGRYHDLGIFLDRVSKYSRIINVDKLRMDANTGGDREKTIRASFVATTFVYDEQAAKAEEGSE